MLRRYFDAMQKQTLPLCLPLGLLPLLLPGCAGRPTTASPASAKAEQMAALTKQFKEIDDNLQMPPAVKAAVKANLMQHQGMDLSKGQKSVR
jgi:hypothetical protein